MIKYFLILTLLVSTQCSVAQNLASARRHIEMAKIDINTYFKSWGFQYDSLSKGNKSPLPNCPTINTR